jgi:ubiquinone/menaquinone biosynthesis C-methylase UbiE
VRFPAGEANVTASPSLVPTDYEAIAPRYDLARGGPIDRLETWRAVLSPWLAHAKQPVVDIGSGTGYWAVALADWFGLAIIAVEPSQAMRRQALKTRVHPRISYVGGRAEHLPLRNGSCAGAWLSTVVHHVSDLRACAGELERVLAPKGCVLIRNAFSGRADGIPWLQYFDHVRHLAEARWPNVDEVVQAFEQAGVGFKCLQSVDETTDLSLASYARRIGVRADSTLASISDEDFERGMSRLEQAVAAETDPRPLITKLDILVLEKA